VSFPLPHPGLVIRYSYLWKQEQDAGHEEGRKDRPCAIVMAVVDEYGGKEVLVLPITHTPPRHAMDAIEIPAETKERLRLDSDRAWIVIAEANEFVWPGPDLRPVSAHDDWAIAYGTLPPRFFAYVRDKFLDRDRHTKSSHVKRTQ